MNLLNVAAITRIVLSTIPFVLMTLRSSHINLDHKYRGHQFLMPVLALIYCIPAMLSANKIAESSVAGINLVNSILVFVPVIGPLLGRFGNKLSSVLALGYGIQLLCNTVIMTGFCVLKQVALPILNRWWSKWRFLYSLISERFYTEIEDKTVLKDEFSDMRKLFSILYDAAVVYGAVLCVLSLLFTDSSFFIPFYPVFSIIVLGEICFFLDGETLDEMGENNDEDEEESETAVDYDVLMKSLEDSYKDRLLAKAIVHQSMGKEEIHDWEQELAEGDPLDQIAATYFQAAAKGADDINADYVYASRMLLHENSVLILNPFYRDLTEYILLPVFHHLLNHGKCLVICGRTTNENDIEDWLRSGLEKVTNLPKLWTIGELTQKTVESKMPDIGILSFRRLYDMETLYLNSEFFHKTTMVIMLEPSNLLGTGQIGLRSVVHYCESKDKKITYVAVDRNADGLVDALSHAIRQSITQVIASPVPKSKYRRMLWMSDGPGLQSRILPRISHYLGIGTELGVLAMHEGIQSVNWYSGSKMPLTDLRWNVEQYYMPICRYIHIQREQSELSKHLHFHESLWQAEFTKDSFVIVEDEFCNLFEMSRTFAARIKKKGFINILSENYLLRDYMCDNEELFTNDPKAVPSIVPDYARTERNFVLRTLMRMAAGPVSEKELSDELAIHGCESQQKAYRSFCDLVSKHTGVTNPRFSQIREEKVIGDTLCTTYSFTADEKFVESLFDSSLKPAHYVIENEKTDTYLMGNRLMGHIEQTILPGQFFSFDGRYYQVREISPETGIIVRRAADHINGREYYRQLRKYNLEIKDRSADFRDLRGITISNCYADYIVETDGYLEQKSRNLLKDASVVMLDTAHVRTIAYKDTLYAQFNGASSQIRFTLCVLLNELFHTIFPNEAGYIVASMGDLPEQVSGSSDYQTQIRALVPKLDVNESISDAIFFIEDSNIDLGLLVSIERNLQRILEILTDYLDWYLDPVRKKNEDDSDDEKEQLDGRSSPVGNKTEPDPKVHVADSNEPDAAISYEADAAIGDENDDAVGHEDDDVDGEDEDSVYSSRSLKSSWVKKIDYLTYGYEKEPKWLALSETLTYLKERRFDDSNLHRSRTSISEFGDGFDYDPAMPGIHYCDFCGKMMKPGTYKILRDGRERCEECTETAVSKRRQFKKVYLETIKEMEDIFDIKIQKKIVVRMVNARKVNDGFDTKFTPSPRQDMRILGYATEKKGKHYIEVENGAPKLKMKQTLVHELTHIWQHENWGDFKYSTLEEKSIVEGMAVWTEIQYLASINESDAAKRYKIARSYDKVSPYGIGMNKYLQTYRIQEKEHIDTSKTPFRSKFPPVK